MRPSAGVVPEGTKGDVPGFELPGRDEVCLFAIDLAEAERGEIEDALAPGELADLVALDRAPPGFGPGAARRRRLVARACLRRILGGFCSADPCRLPLVTGASGKPRLAAGGMSGGSARGFASLEFNASHSGDLLVVAVAVDMEIGIDVEVIRPLADPMAIADLLFSEAERRTLRGLRERERCRAFYAAWTRKEAFLKATGAGLAGDFRSFDVSLRPGDPARIVSLRSPWSDERPDAWRLHELGPMPGTVAALAVRSRRAAWYWRDADGIAGSARRAADPRVRHAVPTRSRPAGRGQDRPTVRPVRP